jgi:hypothetical protein
LEAVPRERILAILGGDLAARMERAKEQVRRFYDSIADVCSSGPQHELFLEEVTQTILVAADGEPVCASEEGS